MPHASGLFRLAALICGVLAASAAIAAPKTTRCGALESARFMTETVAGSTSSTSFVLVPNARATVNIPPGAQRCAKVTFSAVTRCRLNSVFNGVDGCFVRAAQNGLELDPQTGGANFDNESPANIPAARTLVWIVRLDAGTHNFTIKQRVFDADTVFDILSWTLDVELLK